jgi:hypothetical protein
MSRRALHLAVRDVIRAQLGYKDNQCDVTFDGRPPPACGQDFVGIHRGPRNNQSTTALEIAYEFKITMTKRVDRPYDRIGRDLMEQALMGLDDRADAIIKLIHEDAGGNLLAKANAIIGDQANGFTELPIFLGDDGGRLVGGEWFHAEPDSQEVGIALELRFGRALRIQRIEDIAAEFAEG